MAISLHDGAELGRLPSSSKPGVLPVVQLCRQFYDLDRAAVQLAQCTRTLELRPPS